MFGRNGKLDTDWLASVPFFSGFDASTLKSASQLGEKQQVEAGAVLIDQGRVGDACYVIVDGNAMVQMNGEYVTTVGAGSMVGEMALIEYRPRNASVIAETAMTLVAFGTKEFRALLDQSPELSESVLAQLNSRLRANEARNG